jgi:hypothetical protein
MSDDHTGRARVGKAKRVNSRMVQHGISLRFAGLDAAGFSDAFGTMSMMIDRARQ